MSNLVGPQVIKKVADDLAEAINRGEITNGDGEDIVHFASDLLENYMEKPEDYCTFSLMVGAAVYSAIHASL